MPPIKTVIYLDVLLLTNFALTLLFLLAAGLLAGVECRAGRLLLGGAAGAASSLALLAPEAPDAAALLYKVSTAALTVAAAYGWPGGRCFARLVGWFCAGNLLLAGALLLPGAQTNNGCIYLPLSPGALLAGAGGVVLAVQGVLRFLGRGGGQVFPARLTVADTALDVRAFCDTGFSVQEPLSGRAVVLVRFGAVQGRLPPALGTYLEQHFAGAAPLPVPALGVRLVPCTTVAGHCILPAVPASLCCTGSPAGQGRTEHLYAAFADLPPPPDGWEVLVGGGSVGNDSPPPSPPSVTEDFTKEEPPLHHLLSLLCRLYCFLLAPSTAHYINGGPSLPPPLTPEQEKALLTRMMAGDAAARDDLITHNLRLVVYLAKKYENSGVPQEDMISIGTIGLIKAVNTFTPARNIKLATYASRCIGNEILMYLRKSSNRRQEASIDEPLNTDGDGNELLLSDVLGSDENLVGLQLEQAAERATLRRSVEQLAPRERQIMELRFGLVDGVEHTQKEAADALGISQSYISRLEKRIIRQLKEVLERE